MLLLTLTALHYISLLFSDVFPSHIALFLFYFLTVILAPGYTISLLVLPRANTPLRILVSMVLGIAFTYCVLFAFSALNGDIYYAGVLIPAVIPLMLALIGFKGLEGGPETGGK